MLWQYCYHISKYIMPIAMEGRYDGHDWKDKKERERRRSTDWWSCKAGQQRGSMADASFCNGQYIPGSTPYPTPLEDTFSIFIFFVTIFYKGQFLLNLHKWLFTSIEIGSHIVMHLIEYKGSWFFVMSDVTIMAQGRKMKIVPEFW